VSEPTSGRTHSRCTATITALGEVIACTMRSHGQTYAHNNGAGVTWWDDHPLTTTPDRPGRVSSPLCSPGEPQSVAPPMSAPASGTSSQPGSQLSGEQAV
jgi:hypothetical protein